MNKKIKNNLFNDSDELSDSQLDSLIKKHLIDDNHFDTSSLKKRICEKTYLMPQVTNISSSPLTNWLKSIHLSTYLAAGSTVLSAIALAIVLSTNSASTPTKIPATSDWDAFYLLEEQIAYNIDIRLTETN